MMNVDVESEPHDAHTVPETTELESNLEPVYHPASKTKKILVAITVLIFAVGGFSAVFMALSQGFHSFSKIAAQNLIPTASENSGLKPGASHAPSPSASSRTPNAKPHIEKPVETAPPPGL